MDSIDVKSLSLNESPFSYQDLELTRRVWPKSPFPIDESVNHRVVLYDGDIELLSAEAIVNPTNENLTNLGYVQKLAGPELEHYIRRKVKLCATGDVRLTPGFNSQFNHIIHAVPPKYQPKYKTAAETALFHTYFRILETMIERKIRTVVMPTLSAAKSNLPIEDNCHLQLKVIRRMLEKKPQEFDRIVIHVKNDEIYRLPFFCYFPRTAIDEELACHHLSSSLGGPNGEPVIPERSIRIKSKPSVSEADDDSIDLISGLDLSTVVGKTAFSRMRDDIDLQNGSITTTPNCNKLGLANNQLVLRRKGSVFRGCILL